MVDRTKADVIGRSLGVVAVLVAGTAIAFTYSENQKLRSRLQELETANTDLKADADAFNSAWNAQLEKALQDFASFSQAAEQQEATARAERQRLFDAELAQLSQSPIDMAEVERVLARQYDKLRAEMMSPQLRVAAKVLKPGTNQAMSFSLRNIGLGPAEISSVTFSPREAFQVESSTTSEANSEAKYVIRFDKLDNTAAGTGQHGNYRRELLDTRVIPPNAALDVYVEIEDSAHLDWAWAGDLTITYGDGSLDIPNVRAVFVPGNEDAV